MHLGLVVLAIAAVQLHWAGGVPDEAPRVTIVARDLSGAERTFANANDVALPDGQWFVRATAPGWWSEETFVTGDAVPTLVLERASTLHASVNAEARHATIYFQPSSGGTTRAQRCAIAESRIACDLPAGVHDLKFRIDGYASVYRWNANLSAPKSDLGALTFKKGSTFSGRIEFSDKLPENTRLDVSLTPSVEATQNDEVRARANITRIVAHPNARGFFAMDVAPGRYVVKATAGVLTSEEREVNVLDGRETSLREPLLLERPRMLTIRVQPPADPWDRPWRVIANKRSAKTNAEGVVTFATAPGMCEIEVHSGESTWHSAQIDLRDDFTHDVLINETIVRGTVTLGGEPLPSAWITFVAEGSMVRARASDRGTFGARLPHRERWNRIEITTARVNATLKDVRVTDELTIELPGTSLSGAVVDENGKPADAMVDILYAKGGLYHQLRAEGGAFELAGLPPGDYTLTAATRERRTESPIVVHVDESADVTLTVVKAPWIEGVVRSAFGTVGSAGMFVTRTGEIPWAVTRYAVQPDGRYGFPLPAGTRDVTMIAGAPGYAFRLLRTPLPESGTFDIALDPNGGTLRLEDIPPLGDTSLYLVHNGAALPASLATFLANGYIDGDDLHEITLAEDGAYALCRTPVLDEHCTSGVLPRHGTLTLAARR